MFKVRYLSHSGFFIKTKKDGILIDPFISQNPLAKFDYEKEDITSIIVTHGHSDHLGDAIPISKKTKATIFAIHELANYCSQRGASCIGGNIGGPIKCNWGKLWFLPAFHSSSTPDGSYAGCAASVLLEIAGKRIFHAGDTGLTQEFKMIADVYEPDIAILPIGSTFTMGVNEAVIAARWLRAKTIIPMHYNTFQPIRANVNEFKNLIEMNSQECLVLKPNEEFDV